MLSIDFVKKNNWIILGGNRVEKDFRYVFNWLKVQRSVTDPAEIKESDAGRVIICDFDKYEKEKVLIEKGLRRSEDYFYEEDFFELLDDYKLPENRDFYVWGCGNKAEHFLKEMPDSIQISAFIDSYRAGEVYKDYRILSPDILGKTDENRRRLPFVIIAVDRDDEIQELLGEKGFRTGIDYVSYRKILGLPSVLLRKTIFDRSFYRLTCNTMLNHLEILKNGNTRPCCTTFVEHDLNNIFEKNIDELWHSPLHRVLCLSTENHTFSHCDKTMCPLFVTNRPEPFIDQTGEYREMTGQPTTLSLGYDSTCNLYCETCRKELHIAEGAEKDITEKISDKIVKEYLPQVKFLIMAGDGEVLLSRSYRNVYTSPECRPRYIRLLSNGMLFDEKHWMDFPKLKDCVYLLTVSVDAATKETYETIRRGGNFDILKKNMEFASMLRKRGDLRYFRMNFVVQKRNYREMPLFVEWGEYLGVDEVFFTKVLNWGTWTNEEFKEISMMEEDGITPKKELKEVLLLPEMESPIVDLGTIQYSHKEDRAETVENYYMWELEKRGGAIF